MTLINSNMLSVVHSASKDLNRENLQCVFLEVKAKKYIRTTAVNGHSMCCLESSYYGDDDFNCMIPSETCIQVLKVAKNCSQIDIQLKLPNIIIDIAGFKIITDVTPGVFPDYKQVIPEINATQGCLCFSFDIELFKIYKKILKGLGIPNAPVFCFSQSSDFTPIISTMDTGIFKLLFLMMPIRILDSNTTEKMEQNKHSLIVDSFKGVEK